MKLPWIVRKLFGIEQEKTTGIGLMQAVFDLPKKKPPRVPPPDAGSATRYATGKYKWLILGKPIKANTKSEARAVYKEWHGPIPPGTRITQLDKPKVTT